MSRGVKDESKVPMEGGGRRGVERRAGSRGGEGWRMRRREAERYQQKWYSILWPFQIAGLLIRGIGLFGG